MKRKIGSTVFALVAAFAIAGPALGVTVVTTHLVDTLSFDRERCGATWHGDVTLERLVQTRTTSDDTPPVVIENYLLTVLWTDLADADRAYQVVTQGQTRDVPVRQVDGTVWEFLFTEIGQPFTIRTSSGRIVSHDRGILRITSLRDTLGDADPGNDEFLGDTGLSTVGKFPLFDIDEAALCALFLEAAGG